MRRARMSGVAVFAGGVAVAAAATAGAVLGRLPTPDLAPAWGSAWSERVIGADAGLVAAVAERIALTSGLLLFATGAGLLTVLVLGLGRREDGRAGLAVRMALGAGRLELARALIRAAGRRIAAMAALGVGLGVTAVAALDLTWPGLPWRELTEAAPIGTSPWWLILGTGAAGVSLGVAALGVLSPLPGLAARAPTLLRVGRGVTDDPRAGTLRRWAATAQIASSLALALVGLGLARGTQVADAPANASRLGPGAMAVGRYAALPEIAATSLPAMADGLLASPGAWTGVGTRDLVTVDCGACVRGVWYLPVYGVDSTVHAVHGGVIEALGGRFVEGRGFTADDGRDAEWVGVVNDAFRRHFEGGAPIGRRIRLSGGGDRWVRIVGVVELPASSGPGAASADEPTLWLSLAQHPARIVEGVAEQVPPAGYRVLDEPRPLAELRSASLAPLAWSGWMLAAGGLALLLLAFTGSAEVARVEARGRARAAAIRLALGASPNAVARALLRRTTTSTGLGIVLGIAVGALLGRALGVVGGLGVTLPVALSVMIVVAVGVGVR
ncbi:MAG: ABC transporter permease, partial [Gemmatimonadetes bacterium]|nr:ABC transporter permease [Gemmatimonadota bacterium]